MLTDAPHVLVCEPAAPLPFASGELLGGQYRVGAVIGRGGTSHVFEAEDVHLRRRVAIKVVTDPDAGASVLLHEARALAAIRHPGLPSIHGVATHGGWTYLALERLFGVSLEERLGPPGKQVALPVPETIRILTAIADVLGAVHDAGMAHHDLKPGNVMLCPRDRVVLVDFGIMVPEVEAGGRARCGTPRYLAPEAITGAVQPGRAHLIDTYAFGVMGFEMLAGAPPFQAPTIARLLEAHVHAPPPPLPPRCPAAPAALCALIGACLAKDPADRPPTMESILWDLRRLSRRAPTGG